MMITVSIDDESDERMRYIAKETGKTVEDLARIAVEEAALGYFRSDPKKDPTRERTSH